MLDTVGGWEELLLWQALDAIDPFVNRADWHAALIASAISGVVWAFAGGKGEAPKPADFLLEFKEIFEEDEDEEQAGEVDQETFVQRLEQRLLSWAKTHNARIAERRPDTVK